MTDAKIRCTGCQKVWLGSIDAKTGEWTSDDPVIPCCNASLELSFKPDIPIKMVSKTVTIKRGNRK